MKLNFLKSRRFKHGSMATLMTIIVIAVVVIINIIATVLLDRIPSRIDLTADKMYQITEESVDYLSEVDAEVNIYICSSEENFLANGSAYTQANEIIKNYPKYNNKIKVQYVDLVKEPTFVQKFPTYEISNRSIIVKSEKRTRVFTSDKLFSETTNQQAQTKTVWSDAEKMMTSAIMYVTDEEASQAVVLTGHQETPITELTSMLEENNYEVVEQSVVNEEISLDTDLLAIYAPQTDYSKEELTKLDTFLDNEGKFGKSLIYIASATQPKLPNLESFLAEWGVSVGEGVIFETDPKNVYYRNNFVMSLQFGDAEGVEKYTEDLKQPDLPFLSANTRPIIPTFTEKDNRNTKVLLKSADSSILVPLDPPKDFNIDAQTKESFSVGVLGQRTKYEGTTPMVSSVLALGSDAMFNTDFVSSNDYNNNEFVVNVINKISGKEEALNIVSVSFDTETLNINELQYNIIGMVFMFAVPLICIILGTFVWIRRRNK